MSERVKLQHYVPRFYLKNFASQRGKDFIINVFDKTIQKSFKSNVTGVGGENAFYDLTGENLKVEERQALEKILSELDGSFSSVYSKLIQTRSLNSLKWKEKEIIATYVAIQELRTRETREYLKSTGDKIKEFLKDKKLSPELEKEVSEMDNDTSIKTVHLKLVIGELLHERTLTKIILNMKWILYENNTTIPLWTSDHPINKYNPIDLQPYGNLGLQSKGIQVFFPLTPKLGLLFCDVTEYGLEPEKIVCIKENVTFYNATQVGYSTRHIFSVNNDFSLAKSIITNHPELSKIERKRVS